jgi:hypothetical protein
MIFHISQSAPMDMFASASDIIKFESAQKSLAGWLRLAILCAAQYCGTRCVPYNVPKIFKAA